MKREVGAQGIPVGGSEWMILDITHSEEENLEKVAATRKRPLGW